ncbi:hypothetical protein [Glutamicibacter ardleyensis]|uniref:hypothetical protein n=1 Tax=Glutamicibacter ardleyensis TaxID=225894 RepID=UPI003FD6035B
MASTKPASIPPNNTPPRYNKNNQPTTTTTEHPIKTTRRQTLTLTALLAIIAILGGLLIAAIILLPADLTSIIIGVFLLAMTAAMALIDLDAKNTPIVVLWCVLGLSLIGAGTTGLLGLAGWEVAAHLIGDVAIVCLLGIWAWHGINRLRAWLRWRRVHAARMVMLRARNLAEGRYRA